MNEPIPSFLLKPEQRAPVNTTRKGHLTFIDRTLNNLASFIKAGYNQSYTASTKGFLQQFNAGIKLVFLCWNLVIIGLWPNIYYQLLVAALLFFLFYFSRIRLGQVYRRIAIIAFFFGFLIAVPAVFNFITPGKIIFTLVRFDTGNRFWIYHIPQVIGITKEGCLILLLFFIRVTNSITLTLLTIYTTPIHEIVRSLKKVRVPGMFLMVITLCFKFIFILAATAEDTFMALKSRWWQKSKHLASQRIVAGRVAYIFRRSWTKYEEVYMAMVSKGFSGDANLSYLRKPGRKDYIFLVISILPGLAYFLV